MAKIKIALVNGESHTFDDADAKATDYRGETVRTHYSIRVDQSEVVERTGFFAPVLEQRKGSGSIMVIQRWNDAGIGRECIVFAAPSHTVIYATRIP